MADNITEQVRSTDELKKKIENDLAKQLAKEKFKSVQSDIASKVDDIGGKSAISDLSQQAQENPEFARSQSSSSSSERGYSGNNSSGSENPTGGQSENNQENNISDGGGVPEDTSMNPEEDSEDKKETENDKSEKDSEDKKETDDNKSKDGDTPEGGGIPKDQSLTPEEPEELDSSDGKSDEKGEENQDKEDEKEETGNEDETAAELNKKKAEDKKDKGKEDKSKKDGEISASVGTESKKATSSQFLKNAWMQIVPTFTLSAFYIYLHVFLGMIEPKSFSKLGHEWVPKERKIKSPKVADKIGNAIGVLERGCTGGCCFLHFFLVIIGFLIMLMIPPISFILAAYLAWDWISKWF